MRIDGRCIAAEVLKNPLNHGRILDAGDHPELPAATSANLCSAFAVSRLLRIVRWSASRRSGRSRGSRTTVIAAGAVFPTGRSTTSRPATRSTRRYEIGERLQVPGPNYMWSGITYERTDGVTPHWRGIRDDDGRWMVLISHNIDYGEGCLPEPFTGQAYEVAVNYLIYGMTH